MEEESKDTKLAKMAEEAIERTVKDGLTTNNLDIVYKLTKIKHMAKEDENMNYGNYNGRGPSRGSYGEYGAGSYGEYNEGGYGNYGEYGNYGRRGRDRRYRGDMELDRMAGEYGRYQESRGRYGAGEETDKSFHYMVKALEDFIRVLHEEADTPQQKQQLKETLQRSMM